MMMIERWKRERQAEGERTIGMIGMISEDDEGTVGRERGNNNDDELYTILSFHRSLLHCRCFYLLVGQETMAIFVVFCSLWN